MQPVRVQILGVPVDCVDMDTALATVDSMVANNEKGSVIAVNSDKIMKVRRDRALMPYLNSTRLLIPDGIGVVYAARYLGLCQMGRVAGADLMPAICELAARRGYRVFLFGGRKEVNQKTAEVLQSRYSELQIAGNQDGYVKDEDMPDLVERINAARTDILFIALGSPRQEEWLTKYLPDLNIKVCQGVGGTFDVISGFVKRAPLFFQRLNVEWLYRVIAQPSKIPRGLVNIWFGFHVLASRFFSGVGRG